jgi:hypothetical protein
MRGLLNCAFRCSPPSFMRNFSLSALRAHLMFWSVTAAVMIIDDAAMMALIFC